MPAIVPTTQLAKQQAFCEAFALLGSITEAAEQAGIHRITHYGWLRQAENARAEEYREMWEQAQERYKDQLRSEIHRRAVKGWTEPVYQKGTRVGAVRKYSDTLLIFHAKARMPEYRDRQTIEHQGEVGIKVRPDFSRLTDDELAQLRNLTRKTIAAAPGDRSGTSDPSAE